MELSKPSKNFSLDPAVAAKLNSIATGQPSQATEPAATQPKAGVAQPPPKAAPKMEQPAVKAEPVTKPTEEPLKQESKAKPLRDAYEHTKAELATAQAKAAELETNFNATAKEKADAYAKVANLEGEVQGYAKRWKEEVEPLQKQFAETTKKLQEREEALRLRDYTGTSEWHEKFVKPIADVQNEAMQFVNELVATVNGQQVRGNQEHLNHIVGAPDAHEAAARAKALFGDEPAFTSTLVNYRQRLKGLAGKQQEALKQASVESEQWARAQQAKQAQDREKMASAVQERERTYLTSLALPDNDPELQAARQEGKVLADLISNGSPDMTPEKWADTVAKTRVEVQHAAVLKKQMARVQAENAELKKQLAAFQATEPTVETRNGTAPEVNNDEGPGSNTLTRLQKTELAKLTKLAMGR